MLAGDYIKGSPDPHLALYSLNLDGWCAYVAVILGSIYRVGLLSAMCI